MRQHRVRALLMGGQACILYGAAEFSRDIDLAVAADEKNLERLRRALGALKAEPVYVPDLNKAVLERGHACHFRARIDEANGLRIDVMAVLRGCDSFPVLWTRRQRLKLPGIGSVPVLALPDLVLAKKTQRDKDWAMLAASWKWIFTTGPRDPRPNALPFGSARCGPRNCSWKFAGCIQAVHGAWPKFGLPSAGRSRDIWPRSKMPCVPKKNQCVPRTAPTGSHCAKNCSSGGKSGEINKGRFGLQRER